MTVYTLSSTNIDESAPNLVKMYVIIRSRMSSINSLPHNKILDWSKLKAFADDKLNATEKLKFVLGRVEKIVGKGENAGYQHFLLFPQCFQKPSLSGSLKVGIVW